MVNFNKVGTRRTICEVLREIHDITDKDNIEVISRLAEATTMAKSMGAKLKEYKESWSEGFFEDNTNIPGKLEVRG